MNDNINSSYKTLHNKERGTSRLDDLFSNTKIENKG